MDNTDVYLTETSLSPNLKWPSKHDQSEHFSTHPPLYKKCIKSNSFFEDRNQMTTKPLTQSGYMVH